MTFRPLFVVMALLAVGPVPARAGDIEAFGQISGEFRGFAQRPQFPGQLIGAQPSFFVIPEVEASLGQEDRIRLASFVRVDSRDSDRTHFDMRELKWQHFGKQWDLTIGFDTVFWGVAESRHLVDVINQRDFSEDLDGEDKLGQPMVSARLERDWGTLRVFFLPAFRERRFPGVEGRPRFPLPVDSGRPMYQSSKGAKHLDYAIRYTKYWRDWDFGLSYFRGTGREPRLIPNESGTQLIPVYSLIHQVGFDAQYTKNAWLWKLEAIVRKGQGSAFGAAVGGLEYTLYGPGDTDIDLGLLLEYQVDGRDALAPATAYDDDFFVGTRVALNDTQDSTVLAGALVDRNDGTTALSVEAARRMGSDWLLELESRVFMNTAPTDPLHSFANDSWATIRLSWFF